MLRSRLLTTSFIFVCVLACHAQVDTWYSPLPSAAPKETSKYKLTGVVENSVTGEPIRNALVMCSAGLKRSLMTGSDGRFEFEEMPLGFTGLGARKAGFFNEQELSDGRKPPFQFRFAPDTPPVIIRLTPEAVVFGRLVDTDGLPLPHFPVKLISRRLWDGKPMWLPENAAATDEDGRFRFFGLKPGKYFISAGPGQFAAVVSTSGNPAGLGFPQVRYPAGGTEDSPALVSIKPGQKVEVNLTIRAEPFYTVTGTIGGIAPNQRVGVVLISKGVLRQGDFTAMVNPDTNTFRITQVAVGDYVLMLSGADNSGRRITGSVPVQVQGDVTGLHLEAQPTMSIPVRVRVERRPQPGVQRFSLGGEYYPVRLKSLEHEHLQFVSIQQDLTKPDSPNSIRNVPAGRYRVAVDVQGDLYVASASFGNIDLLSEDLEVDTETSQGQIDIVLRDDAPTIHVKASGTDHAADAKVVVVPSSAEPYLYDDHTTRTPPPESIPVRLRPGSFTILLFDNVEQLEYGSREVLEPYLSKGVSIVVAPGEAKTVTCDLIRRGED